MALLIVSKKERIPDLYASEYLSKHKSHLMFKLRSLKKRFDQLSAVYSRNGNLYCRLSGGSEIFVRDEANVNKLEERFLNHS